MSEELKTISRDEALEVFLRCFFQEGDAAVLFVFEKSGHNVTTIQTGDWSARCEEKANNILHAAMTLFTNEADMCNRERALEALEQSFKCFRSEFREEYGMEDEE